MTGRNRLVWPGLLLALHSVGAAAQEPTPAAALKTALASARAGGKLEHALQERWFVLETAPAQAKTLHLCRTRGELLPEEAGVAFEVHLVEARRNRREESSIRFELSWEGALRRVRRVAGARWKKGQQSDAGSTLIAEPGPGGLALRVETVEEAPRPLAPVAWDERCLPVEVALFLLPLLPGRPASELRFTAREKLGILDDPPGAYALAPTPTGFTCAAQDGQEADDPPRRYVLELAPGEEPPRLISVGGSLSLAPLAPDEARRRLAAAEQGEE